MPDLTPENKEYVDDVLSKVALAKSKSYGVLEALLDRANSDTSGDPIARAKFISQLKDTIEATKGK